MKLRALRVNQFRKFTSPVGVVDLRDGLNVLVGPNEYGKSTLMRALQAVLFERYNARAASVRALANADSGAAPVVEIEFELNGERYWLRKRFLQRAYARLGLPNGVLLEGEEAEDRLRRLLGFEKAGGKGARAEDMGLWSLLWLEQGAGFGDLAITEPARGNLRDALQGAVGDVLGGAGQRRLSRVIRESLEARVTGVRQTPRGTYREAIDRVTALDEQLAALRERRAQLAADLERLADLEQQFAPDQQDDSELRLQEQLQDARQRCDVLRELALKVERSQAERQLIEDRLTGLRKTAENRARLEQAITRLARQQREDEEREALQRQREQDLRDALNEAREAQRLATARCGEARTVREAAREQLAAAERGTKRRELQEALAVAERQAVILRRLDEALAANPVDENLLARVQDAQVTLRGAEAACSAAATRLEFALEPGAESRVRVSGRRLERTNEAHELLENTTVNVDGVGSFTVHPRVRDAQTLQLALDAARAEFEALLAHAGQSTLDAVREQAAARRADETAAREARAALQALAPTATGGIAGLRERLAALVGEGESRSDDDPGLPSLEAVLSSAQAEVEAAEHALQEAGLAVDRAAAALEQHRADSEGDLPSRVRNREQRRLAEAELAGLPPSSDQETAREALEAQLAGCDAELAALREAAGGDSPALLRSRVERLEESLATRQRRRDEARREKARLEGAIEAAAGAGLDEALAELERQRDLAASELAREAREVEVLSLLTRTLDAAEREAHDRFMAPIVNRMNPYLGALFPGARIELDESLEPQVLTRDDRGAAQVEHLSLGTREQIGVLARLAVAELLAEQGRPAMVVLDDALAYSDDLRMQRLFDVLNAAAQRLQIIVLTCRDSLFAGIGGHALQLVPVDEGELQSA